MNKRIVEVFRFFELRVDSIFIDVWVCRDVNYFEVKVCWVSMGCIVVNFLDVI